MSPEVRPLSVFSDAAATLVSERTNGLRPLKSMFAVAETPANTKASASKPLKESPEANSKGNAATPAASSGKLEPIRVLPRPKGSALEKTRAPVSS